jgi:hypothetical protein
MGLDRLVVSASSRSNCSVLVISGSKAVMGAPMPRVELTRPLVPVPAPPAATVVPPVPEPTVPPSPPTPPPGVFCTMPVLTPRMLAPDFRPQQVGVGDIQVIAGDVDVEIVLQRERNRVIDGEINLAIAHERVDARRVANFGWGTASGR